MGRAPRRVRGVVARGGSGPGSQCSSRAAGPSRELVRFQQTRLDIGAIGEIDVIKVRVEDERLAAAVAGAEADAEQARLALLGSHRRSRGRGRLQDRRAACAA